MMQWRHEHDEKMMMMMIMTTVRKSKTRSQQKHSQIVYQVSGINVMVSMAGMCY